MSEYILPYLRWAGGKRWLSRRIAPILRQKLNGRYFEPFLGAGAMFFMIAPKRALLSDINPELINSFQMVKESPEKLLRAIRKLSIDSDTYYQILWPQNSVGFKQPTVFIDQRYRMLGVIKYMKR